MRLIGTFKSEEEVKKIALFLTSEGIGNQYDLLYDADMHPCYDLWIFEEEDFPLAFQYYEEFLKNPTNPKFFPRKKEFIKVQRQVPRSETRKPFSFFSSLTHWVLIVCAILFIANSRQEEMIQKERSLAALDFSFTSIEQTFLFDYPLAIEHLNALLSKYPIPSLEALKEEPLQVQKEFKQVLEEPVWKGGVFLLLDSIHNGSFGSIPALFEKIREGEVWRLFSPTLLHRDIWHIFFNMGWLLILGKQIELRLKKPRLILLILFLGVFSNVAQYLMSGPYFLGFSGVVAGFAGFIWSRQKKAPWEGYPFHKTTALFLFYLILLMFVVSLVCFLLQAFSFSDFSSNIANTAHISGGILGLILGRFNFFAKRFS